MSSRRTLSVPAGVGWTSDTDTAGGPCVFVAPLPHGPVSVLPGVSALIWLAAVYGSGAVSEEVAHATGHTVETVREDVESFLDKLVSRGLLTRT